MKIKRNQYLIILALLVVVLLLSLWVNQNLEGFANKLTGKAALAASRAKKDAIKREKLAKKNKQGQPGQVPMKPSQVPMQPAQVPMQPAQVPMKPAQVPMQPGQVPMQPDQVANLPQAPKKNEPVHISTQGNESQLSNLGSMAANTGSSGPVPANSMSSAVPSNSKKLVLIDMYHS